MKKFIFGYVLLLADVIGLRGRMIACTTSGGGYTETLSYLEGLAEPGRPLGEAGPDLCDAEKRGQRRRGRDADRSIPSKRK